MLRLLVLSRAAAGPAEYALVSGRLKAGAWTKTETSHGELLASSAKNGDVLPGQKWRRIGDSNS
jgi:hypothetical protein